MEKGLIHIYTGDGKGKTTASVGLSTRCSLCGGKVLFTQFLKDYSSGECENNPLYEVFKAEPFCGFWSELSDDDKKKTALIAKEQLYEVFNKANDENYDMLVLDEILCAVSLDIISLDFLIDLLEKKSMQLEVVMTGRSCPKDLYEYADYVSEIKEIKHPYKEGIKARKGIEF